MDSPLTSNGHRKEWLRLFTTRIIVVGVLFGLAASVAHTGLVNSLPKAAAEAGRQRVNSTPTPLPTASPTPTPTPPAPALDQEPLRVPAVAPDYEADKATYPQLALIGVQFDRQQAMSLKEV